MLQHDGTSKQEPTVNSVGVSDELYYLFQKYGAHKKVNLPIAVII